MKTPTSQHPHSALQRQLQAYDPHLWLVFSARARRWVVVWEGSAPVATHPILRGMEGCCGEWSRWQVAKIIWDRDGCYLDPSLHASLILDAVKRNDSSVSGGIAERMDAVDRREAERRVAAKRALRDETRSIARYAWDTAGKGRVSVIPGAGTLRYD